MAISPEVEHLEQPTTENPWRMSALILAGLLAVSLLVNGIVVWRVTGGGAVAPADAQVAGGRPSVQDLVGGSPVDVSADDDPAVGQEDAAVEVIAFMDYQCPYCARFYQTTYPRLYDQYIAKGKVRYVTRDFPLGFHGQAMPAAIAASCVRKLADDAAFYRFQEVLMEAGNLSEAGLKSQATALGVNDTAFDECVADPDGGIAAEIAADMADGEAAGVQGTPTFFVNGRMISGAQPFEVFAAAIEAELED